MKIKGYTFTFSLLTLALFLFACGGNSGTKVDKVEGLPEVVLNEEGQAITTSGYPYIHHIANNGKRPVVGDRVSYHETIFQNDSTIYSTRLLNKPITSVLPGLEKLPRPIPPDYEALLLMAIGDSLTVIQDLDSFDVNSLPGGVTSEDEFIYHLKMIDIVSKERVDAELAILHAREQSVADTVTNLIDAFEKGDLKDQLKSTENGVQYMQFKEGTGRAADSGNFVTVHFSGFLKDRTNFDNSFASAKPFTFRLGRGRVIKGWDEGIDQMAVGGKAIFFIPYNLAYGVAGKPPTIPEKADLIFYVEVIDVY